MSVPEPLITTSPDQLSGTPVFAGTRVPVQTLIDYLEAGDPLEAFLADFPSVSREHAVAVLELAKSALLARSEERRVGKECRCRWSPYHGKQRSAEVEKVRFVG